MAARRPSILDAGRIGVAAAMDLVLPRSCPGCGGPGPWCDGCAATLRGRPRRVRLPELATATAISTTAISSAATGRLPPIWALTRYTDPVRSAIVAGKEHGRRDLPVSLGRALGAGLLRLHRLGLLPDPLWLVPAPSRRAAARIRGGDPVAAMATAAARLAAEHGLPAGVAPCLVTAGSAADSVGLDASARAVNLLDRVRLLPKAAPPAGVSVVLIDDVLTTGATTAAACQALRVAGVQVGAVVVLASVPGWISTR